MTKHNVRRITSAGLIGLVALALAACGGKPSQDELKDAMMEGTESVAAAGIDEATYEKYVDCAVEDMYGTMSDDGLETLMETDVDGVAANGNVDGLSAEDQEAFTAALTDCASVLMPETATSGS